MKLSQTSQTISNYADGITSAGAPSVGRALCVLAAFLVSTGASTLSDFTRAARRLRATCAPNARTEAQIPMSTVLDQLNILQSVCTSSGASSQAKEIGLLVNLLQKCDSAIGESGYLELVLDQLRQAMNPDAPDSRIAHFIGRLKSESGGEAFEATFSALSSSDLTREGIVEVAMAVYGGIPKGTSRKAALGYIRKPHDARVSASRGIQAMGGRSAA